MDEKRKPADFQFNRPNCTNDKFTDLVWDHMKNDATLYTTCWEIFSKENFAECANHGHTKDEFLAANSTLLSSIIVLMIRNVPDHPLVCDLRKTMLSAINFKALSEKFFDEEIME